MLVAQHLSKSYPTVGEPLHVLRDVSLACEPGQSIAIVGPSGSGKTTLLQILGVLDHPDDGKLEIGGDNPFELSVQQRASFRNQKIGFVFQDHRLLPQLSLLENVLIPALAFGCPDESHRERAVELLDAVGLGNRQSHLPSELSGGERERGAIARALLMRPTLILADEPTGNLDQQTAQVITDLLLKLQGDENAVLVTVTHSQALADAMDRRLTLQEGCLVESECSV